MKSNTVAIMSINLSMSFLKQQAFSSDREGLKLRQDENSSVMAPLICTLLKLNKSGIVKEASLIKEIISSH